MDNNDIITVLNGLIETCRDGQNGFQEAAENVTRPDLREYFAKVSTERAKFVGELQQEVRRLGGDPENTGSVAASLHRAWIDVKGAFTGKDDGAILAECERGEDSALNAYNDALDKQKLPANIRTIVAQQRDEVRQVHDRVRKLRDLAKSAP